MDPYQELANAIIVLAAKDYRSALRRMRKNGENKIAADELRRLEQFFRSGWYEMLTDLDGEYLIKKLREEENKK